MPGWSNANPLPFKKRHELVCESPSTLEPLVVPSPVSSSSVLMDKFGSWMATRATTVNAREGSLCFCNVVLGKDLPLNAGDRQWLGVQTPLERREEKLINPAPIIWALPFKLSYFVI